MTRREKAVGAGNRSGELLGEYNYPVAFQKEARGRERKRVNDTGTERTQRRQ